MYKICNIYTESPYVCIDTLDRDDIETGAKVLGFAPCISYFGENIFFCI